MCHAVGFRHVRSDRSVPTPADESSTVVSDDKYFGLLYGCLCIEGWTERAYGRPNPSSLPCLAHLILPPDREICLTRRPAHARTHVPPLVALIGEGEYIPR